MAKRGRPRKVKEDTEGIVKVPRTDTTEEPMNSEKKQLLELYEFMMSRGIHSISDLEVKIANCRD